MTFYTYLWLREDGTPYYVGKGKDNRAFTNRHHIQKMPTNKNLILLQEFESEEDAFFAERFLIEFYGRTDLGTGCLRNQTEGGEGSVGYKHTVETKKKFSLRPPQVFSGEQAKIHSKRMQGSGNPMFGKKRKPTGTWLKNLQTNWQGRTHTEETKQRMKESAKKRWAATAGR